MEEDMKMLEKFINEPVKSGEFNKISNKEIQALENLLTRYKQLEEENKELKKVKIDGFILNNPWLFEYLNEVYIFKGKVKEKIDKTKFYIPEYQGEFVAIEDLEKLLEEE